MASSPTSPYVTLPLNQQGLLVRTEAVPPSVFSKLDLDSTDATCVEIAAGNELYSLVTQYLVEAGHASSYTLDIGSARARNCCDSDDDCDEDPVRKASKDLGLGVFSFQPKPGERKVHALHQTLGEVVGTNCGPALMKSLVLIAGGTGAIDLITAFCDTLIAKADETSTSSFSIFRWHVQYSYWRKAEVVKARSMDSVVLPQELKSKLVEDMAEFVSPSTREWYLEHGVPYKRSYLLHGSPGAGKTSCIAALAGKFKRNVCYFSSLSHPEMTDDNLKAAVQRVPAKSILVLEDVDALFSADDGRKKSAGDRSALTFSGVLNALDGVGGSTGQIFILTTNHRERLDPALIRCGRVDMHIEFKDACAEQMRDLFAQFYKHAPPELAEQFKDSLLELLGDKTVSMAALQHYFTMMRRQPAEVAAAEAKKVLEEAEAHGMRLGAKKEEEAKNEAKEEAKGNQGKGGKIGSKKEVDEAEDQKTEDGATSSDDLPEDTAKSKKALKGASGKEVHVHVHVD